MIQLKLEDFKEMFCAQDRFCHYNKKTDSLDCINSPLCRELQIAIVTMKEKGYIKPSAIEEAREYFHRKQSEKFSLDISRDSFIELHDLYEKAYKEKNDN